VTSVEKHFSKNISGFSQRVRMPSADEPGKSEVT